MNELILSSKFAYSKYNNEQTKQKQNTATTKKTVKSKAVFEQIAESKF